MHCGQILLEKVKVLSTVPNRERRSSLHTEMVPITLVSYDDVPVTLDGRDDVGELLQAGFLPN